MAWNGTTNYVEGPATYTTNTDGSGTTVRTFQASGSAQLEALQDSLGTSYSYELQEGPVWTLTATLSYNINTGETAPTPQWTFTNTRGSQHIFDSNIALVSNLDTDTRERIRARLKNPQVPIPLVKRGSDSQLSNATIVYKWLSANVDSRLATTINVTRTITVSKSYVNSWAQNNGGYVLSRSTLISNTGCPNYIYSRLPIGGYKNRSNGLRVYGGYLEIPEDRQDVSNNQVQLSSTWIYDEYPEGWYQIV